MSRSRSLAPRRRSIVFHGLAHRTPADVAAVQVHKNTAKARVYAHTGNVVTSVTVKQRPGNGFPGYKLNGQTPLSLRHLNVSPRRLYFRFARMASISSMIVFMRPTSA